MVDLEELKNFLNQEIDSKEFVLDAENSHRSTCFGGNP